MGLLRRAALGAAFATATVLLAGCFGAREQLPPQSYIPVSRTVLSWGEIQLSPTRLHLEAFEGDMELEYVGTMTEDAGEELEGASVFRIKNAEKFYKRNSERENFCVQPARFVAVNSTTGAHMWSTEISLTLLMNSDWSKYRPKLPGYCAGGTYVRASG
jgi:hypothetical protein